MKKSLRGVVSNYMVEAMTDLSRVSLVTVLNETGHRVEYTERKDKVILACTLSHMRAMLTARKMGFDLAVFLEDDVNFDTHPLWKLSLRELAQAAPRGWKGIQLGFGAKRTDVRNKILGSGVLYIVRRRFLWILLASSFFWGGGQLATNQCRRGMDKDRSRVYRP